MCLFSSGSHYVVTTTEWYTKCNWKCHWCFYNILTSKNIKNYSLSLVYVQHMAIAGKEPCFFGWLISSDSPKNKKKRKFNDKHLSIAFSYKFKLFILNNMPINLKLQRNIPCTPQATHGHLGWGIWTGSDKFFQYNTHVLVVAAV